MDALDSFGEPSDLQDELVDVGQSGQGLAITVLASAAWETPFRVNAHQIASRLARRGHRILFVESLGLRRPAPLASRADRLRIAGRVKRFARGIVAAEENLHVLSPLALPHSQNPALRVLSRHLLLAQIRRAQERLAMRDSVVWAFLPTAAEWLDALPSRFVVYHCVDDYAGNPGVDPDRIRRLERGMVERSNLVLASSRVLANRLAQWRDVELVENVADVQLFEQALGALPEPPELRGLPRPRVVYMGNLAAYRIDFELLLAFARANRAIQLVLLGDCGFGDVGPLPTAFEALRRMANVTCIPARPQHELPYYLAHCQVALLPLLDNAHTRASYPLKLWEYLSAGLPVVARALPNLLPLEEAGLLRTATNSEEFRGAVRAALQEDENERRARSLLARAHGWEERIDDLEDLLGERLGLEIGFAGHRARYPQA